MVPWLRELVYNNIYILVDISDILWIFFSDVCVLGAVAALYSSFQLSG